MVDIREFRRKLRRFEQFLSNQLEDCCCGVSIAQCHCLLAIEELKRTTVGELADYLQLDKSTLSRTVESLVQIGFIDRETDPNDRRRTWIYLTETGMKQAEEMHQVNDEYFLHVIDHIPNREQEQVVRSLGLFIDAISQFEEDRRTNQNCCE
jgi:DNA-binding MarR family transcriptional regulator